MAKIVKPPTSITSYKTSSKSLIFLAGSIEMNGAEDWQSTVQNHFDKADIVFFNPRRDDWDTSWIQRKSNKQFNTQVTWELDGLDYADHILMHFDSKTKSPITLAELGLQASSGKLIVSCSPEFWRYGNVEMICDRFAIPLVDTLADAIILLQARLDAMVKLGRTNGGQSIFKILSLQSGTQLNK